MHPNFLISLTLNFAKPFISSKFWRKVHFIKNIHEIFQFIDRSQIVIPNYVYRLNPPKFLPAPMFGRPLLDILQREQNIDGLPLVIVQCKDYLSNHYNTEGLFRISGADAEVKKIVKAYNIGFLFLFRLSSGFSFPFLIFFHYLKGKMLIFH